MENDFLYAEVARRKASKRRALELGESEQKRLMERHVAAPPQSRAVGRPSVGTAKGTRAGPPSPTRAGPPSCGKVALKPKGLVQPRAKRPVAGAAHGIAPAPQLMASEERLLLESGKLDLFGQKHANKLAVCPDCHHELVNIICLGTRVRACFTCKGVWFPYQVIHDFARDSDWFRQVGPAIDLYRNKLAEEKAKL